jgi:hypothetical protein
MSRPSVGPALTSLKASLRGSLPQGQWSGTPVPRETPSVRHARLSPEAKPDGLHFCSAKQARVSGLFRSACARTLVAVWTQGQSEFVRSEKPRATGAAARSPRRASAMCACWSRAVLSTTEPLTTAPAATERLADRSRHALPAPQRRCSWRSVAHPLGNAAVGRSRRADGRLASVRASRACRVALTRATSIRASRRRSATRLGQRGSRVTWGGALAFMRKGSRGARSAGAFRSALELAPTTAASDLARRCLRRAGLRPRRRGSAAA